MSNTTQKKGDSDKVTNEKPVSIPLDFEDALGALLQVPHDKNDDSQPSAKNGKKVSSKD